VARSPSTRGELPVLHATHTEGGQQSGENNSGFYFGDTIYVTTSYDMFNRTGLTQADVHHERYLKDRVLYDGLVFRVESINITGQINERDTMVSFEGTQVKPDELADSPQFAEYALSPSRIRRRIGLMDSKDQVSQAAEFFRIRQEEQKELQGAPELPARRNRLPLLWCCC
jgi:hypothetical protein